MRTTLAALAFFLVGTSALCAQTVPATVMISDSPGHNCPISVSARRWAPGGMALAQDRHAAPGREKLYLHFAPGNTAGVATASVTLHGASGHAHVELAGSGTDWPSMTETFQLTSGEGGMLLDSSVALRRLANVRWVAITSIHFADGTDWHESQDSSCHVAPNGFRLVAGGN